MAPDLRTEVEKEWLPLIAADCVTLGRMVMQFKPSHTSAIVTCCSRLRYQKSDRPSNLYLLDGIAGADCHD